MSAVCAAALLGCLVDLNVLDNQVAGVQTLGVGVGLGVLEERREKLGALDGPASLAHTELLACDKVSVYGILLCILAHGWPHLSTMGCVRTLGSTASAPGISPHWHSLALLLDVLEVGEGALKLPAVDGLGGLASILEADSQVRATSAGALSGFDLGRSVADHFGGCVGERMVFNLVDVQILNSGICEMECSCPRAAAWQRLIPKLAKLFEKIYLHEFA